MYFLLKFFNLFILVVQNYFILFYFILFYFILFYYYFYFQKIIFESKPYEKFFENEKENLVYLTADSPNTIDTFDETKIYIIGGIVDKNRYKVRKKHK